ncbi:unnamed protein product, partial [Strongylus vulgaris]
RDPNSKEVRKKKIPVTFFAEQTVTAPEEIKTDPAVPEDSDDDIIRAPKAHIRRKSRGFVEDDVGYTQKSQEQAVPMRAVKANVGPGQVEEKSVSGEEASRSLSGIGSMSRF